MCLFVDITLFSLTANRFHFLRFTACSISQYYLLQAAILNCFCGLPYIRRYTHQDSLIFSYAYDSLGTWPTHEYIAVCHDKFSVTLSVTRFAMIV